MNQKAKIGLALVGTLGAIYAAGMFDASQKLQFGDSKLTGKKFHLTNASIFLDLPVINTKSTTLPFSSFDGSLKYNGKELSKVIIQKWEGSNKVNIPIKANSTIILPIEIKIDYLSLGGKIKEMIDTKDFLGSLTVEGNIKSLGLLFPAKSKIF